LECPPELVSRTCSSIGDRHLEIVSNMLGITRFLLAISLARMVWYLTACAAIAVNGEISPREIPEAAGNIAVLISILARRRRRQGVYTFTNTVQPAFSRFNNCARYILARTTAVWENQVDDGVMEDKSIPSPLGNCKFISFFIPHLLVFLQDEATQHINNCPAASILPG
jgi:hypothetical protein